MSDEAPSDNIIYMVVRNADGAYSIWPVVADMPIPAGWAPADPPCRGTKEECLTEIDRVWTDMRPLAVRIEDPAQ